MEPSKILLVLRSIKILGLNPETPNPGTLNPATAHLCPLSFSTKMSLHSVEEKLIKSTIFWSTKHYPKEHWLVVKALRYTLSALKKRHAKILCVNLDIALCVIIWFKWQSLSERKINKAGKE